MLSCCLGIHSTAGQEVGDWEGMNFYTATKHAVTALAKGLRMELRGIKSNIKISVRKRIFKLIIHVCIGSITR